MNYLLKMQSNFLKIPFGKYLFSILVAKKAPYFETISPVIQELRHNYIRVSMRKRIAIQNHLQTVHAIASCNLCEFAAGICMEASIPKHRRWIPLGMEVGYHHKAKTDLIAECDLSSVNWETCDEVLCNVNVLDKENIKVVSAIITMKVSNKKK